MSDVAGSTKTRATISLGADGKAGVFEKAGDADWYKISLKAGQDYAVAMPTFDFSTTFAIRNAAGKVLASQDTNGEQASGFEFRAKTSGTYYVAVSDDGSDPDTFFPHRYEVRITRDVRGDANTQETLGLGQTRQSLFTWSDESDWFKVNLTAGRTYTFQGSDREAVFPLLKDAAGNDLADASAGPGNSFDFTPTTSGVYFLTANPSSGDVDYAAPYTLGYSLA